MKVSTRARYGIRALIDIGLTGNNGPVLVKDIAKRQDISPLYLGHLITPMIAAGMIRSMRGARGGVWLAKPPAEINLHDVIQVLDGSTAPVECVDKPETCKRSETCVMSDVWCELKEVITDLLGSTTLQDLVDRYRVKVQPLEEMYHI